MALTALLFAHHGAGLEGEPPAVRRVAGVSVIERQIAQVRALGAARVCVAVERMPPELAAILDRAGVEVVRAAQSFAVIPEDQVLVIQDSLVVDHRIIAAVVGRDVPALAVWKGRAGHEGAQRIDPATHWAGVSLYSGAFVAQVLDGLGEWDLQATLLRAAFTEGRPARVDAATLATYEPELRRDAPLLWHPVHTVEDASGASVAQLARMRRKALGWPARFVTGRLEQRLIPLALHRRISSRSVEIAAIIAALGSITGLVSGWLWPGLLLGLLAGWVQRMSAALASARDDPASRLCRDAVAALVFEAGVCVALAGNFASTRGWTAPFALAALILVASAGSAAAAALYRLLSERHLDDAGPFERRWATVAATPDALLWSLLLFAAFGTWYAGFIWLALYTTLTFCLVQARFVLRLTEFARANSPLMAANIAAARTQFLSRKGQSSN